MTGGGWLVPWHPEPGEHPTLLCLPQAGSGCWQFRPWQQHLGADVSVVGVQLPGRETRWDEPHPASVDEAVAAVVDELVDLVGPSRPVVVFGQSFGGLLGYEVTRRLGARGRWPTALVVAACRPPHLWVTPGGGLDVGDEELVRVLDVLAPGGAELDEDSRDVVLDLLRRDARLSSTYRHPGGDDAGVRSALHAWGGDRDEVVTADQLDGWRRYAAGRFGRRQFPGGHYFCAERADTVVPLLRGLLDGRPGTDVAR